MSKAKPKEPFDKETLRKQYEEIRPKYERLTKNLKEALEIFLEEKGFDYVGVFSRVKEFDSFWEKIHRKGYDKPFEQNKDFCGLRIVCLYDSDLKKIARIINKEFDDVKKADKSEGLNPDEFGYRSIHLTFAVKKSWLRSPHYRGLNGLRAEVQIRTTLMHAWAEIEHKLRYKKDEYPEELDREFAKLSMKMEEADEQFDALRKAKDRYRKKLLSKEAKESGRFDVYQPLNIDSLQALLDFYFHETDRERLIGHTSTLLREMIEHNVSLRDIAEGFEKVKDVLPIIEGEMLKDYPPQKKLAQIGVARLILDLTKDDYWAWRNSLGANGAGPKWLSIVEVWRDKLAKEQLSKK